jgi:hypothetical protein
VFSVMQQDIILISHRREVLTVVAAKKVFLRYVMSCNLVQFCQYYGGTCSPKRHY